MEVFYKKTVICFYEENTCVGNPFLQKAVGLRSTTLLKTQVFSFEYCKIFKNTYLEENLQNIASADPCCTPDVTINVLLNLILFLLNEVAQ